MEPDPLTFCKYLQIDNAGFWTKTQHKICELIKYKGEKQVLEEFNCWHIPDLPVNGKMLLDHKVPQGPIMKATLDELRQIWKFSDFVLKKEELLERVEDIVRKFQTDGIPKPDKPVYGRKWKKK